MSRRQVSEKDAPRGEIRHLKFVTEYLRPYRCRLALAVVAILLTSGAVLGAGAGLRFLVDAGMHGESGEHELNRAYAILMAIIGLLAVASYARFFLVAWLGERVIADIRRDVYAHLLRMHVGFFETARTGDVLSRLTADTTLLHTVMVGSVSMALRHAVLGIGGCILLLLTSGRLTSYVLLIVPVVVVPVVVLGRQVRRYSRDSQDRVADIGAQAEESLNAIRTVHAFSLEERERARFEGRIQAVLGAALNRVRTKALMSSVVIMLIFGAIVTVMWLGSRDLLLGHITAGELSAFMFYSAIVAASVGGLTDVMGEMQRAAGASERLRELLQRETLLREPANPLPLPDAGASALVFDDVSFTYPARPERAALQHVSFRVEPGETVALVGASGAGKTTLFQLLLRFYAPDSGHIRLGNVDIQDAAMREWRRLIGLVPQDPVMFSTDAWDNIRCGMPEADDATVLEAARAAGALEFLEKLPQGLATPLGEKGVRLSGGQRQRLAIARALVRNPSILLLDEATSALDAQNEHLVQQALATLMRGRTTLVIAHRLSTIRHASRIVFLNDGRIEAIGTHEELMGSHEAYARLAKLQFHQ